MVDMIKLGNRSAREGRFDGGGRGRVRGGTAGKEVEEGVLVREEEEQMSGSRRTAKSRIQLAQCCKFWILNRKKRLLKV